MDEDEEYHKFLTTIEQDIETDTTDEELDEDFELDDDQPERMVCVDALLLLELRLKVV